MPTEDADDAARPIDPEEIEKLCSWLDHPSRVIERVTVDESFFDGYDHPKKARFDLTAVVRTFLYKYLHDIGQRKLERRLKGATFLYQRFGLHKPLKQGDIYYNKTNRFTLSERRALKEAADHLRECAIDHDLMREGEPRLDPEKVDDEQVTDEQIIDAIQRARNRGLKQFDTRRADNATYEDLVFYERLAYLSYKGRGTTTRSISDTNQRFERLTGRHKVPCPNTHWNAMKSAATPPEQTSLDQFTDGQRPEEWHRIRDLLLPAFHEAIADNLAEMDDDAIREPVDVAMDSTYVPFAPSPWKDKAEIGPDDEWVVVEHDDGTTERKYPKEDFPEMVHGWKDGHERVYEFAVITIVGRDTPIIIGVEPVRKASEWETEEAGDTSKARAVRRLLEQAEQHVDINRVYADRDFDVHEVRDVIDRKGYFHRIPKRKYADDYAAIEKIEEHPDDHVDAAVNRDASLTFDGRTHDVSILYDRSTEEEGKYFVMPTNEDVEPERVRGIAEMYRDRWRVECEFRAVKENFLPRVGTDDYRIRFLYFLLGCFLYNVWRTTNMLFRGAVSDDVNLGESPPIPAGELVEFIWGVLFDPGD